MLAPGRAPSPNPEGRVHASMRTRNFYQHVVVLIFPPRVFWTEIIYIFRRACMCRALQRGVRRLASTLTRLCSARTLPTCLDYAIVIATYSPRAADGADHRAPAPAHRAARPQPAARGAWPQVPTLVPRRAVRCGVVRYDVMRCACGCACLASPLPPRQLPEKASLLDRSLSRRGLAWPHLTSPPLPSPHFLTGGFGI